MSFPARLLGILFAFILLLFVSGSSFAQNNESSLQNTQAKPVLSQSTNPEVPSNIHNWTQVVVIEVMSSFICQLTGVDMANRSASCLGVDPQTGKIGFVENGGGAIGMTSQMIGALYTPPLHTYDYVNYLSSNFGISKPTHAQVGLGLGGLAPLVKIWTTFRNIVYLLFVVVFAFIGIAIMLRVRIDPRTVMTVQNQIPKIIISLILVTLSLAIAGFLIDIMWLLIYITINTLSSAGSGIPAGLAGQLYNNPLSFIGTLFGADNINGNAAGAIGDAVSQGLTPQNPAPATSDTCDSSNPLTTLFTCNVGDIFALTVGSAINSIVAGITGFFIGVAAFFIISIAILYSMIKLWFALLKAYVFILFDIVLAPFWIVAGLLPGNSSLGFGNWIRDLLGNLMAFPAVLALFLLGKLFVTQFGAATATNIGSQFVPPLIGGAVSSDKIGALIGLGIILASPHVVEMTKKAFRAPQIGAGGVEGVSSGQAVTAALGGAIASRMYYRDRMGNLQGPLGGLTQSRFQSGNSKTAGIVRTVLKIQKPPASTGTSSSGSGGTSTP